MAAIPSTSGMQDVTQAAFRQLRLQQARQNAERAEQQARNLRQQAAEARREADRAEENARELSLRSGRAQGEAGRARQGLAMLDSANQMKAGLSAVLDRTVAARNEVDRGTPSQKPASAPVINTSGQVTGLVINTAA